MAKKRMALAEVIKHLDREDIFITVGDLNPDAYGEYLKQAIGYLKEYQDSQDAAEVADKGLAEVGATLRRQREAMAFLRGEQRRVERESEALRRRCDVLTAEVERLTGCL